MINPNVVKTIRLIPKLSLKELSENMVVLIALINAMISNQKISAVAEILLLGMRVPSKIDGTEKFARLLESRDRQIVLTMYEYYVEYSVRYFDT